MKILISSGFRGEWGYYTPIMKELENRKIKYDIMFHNMAPLYEYGKLSSKAKEHFKPNQIFEYYSSFHGDDLYSMSKNFSVLCSSISDHLHNYDYDFILIAGDRIEQFAMAAIANIFYIPVGHIQAGELSGNIDGVTRHAIGKLVRLHFAANQDAHDRLIKLGEDPSRVILTGAPQLDDLFTFKDSSASKMVTNLSNYILCVYHGNTDEVKDCLLGFKNLMEVMQPLQSKIIFIEPNNDAGGRQIKKLISEYRRVGDMVFTNIPRNDYLYLLKNSQFMIGNSSSGLLEAPVFKQCSINIGNRQMNRIFGENVINCGYYKDEIRKALSQQPLLKERLQINGCSSPYGDGPASKKILQAIFNIYSKEGNGIKYRKLTV